MPSLTGMDYVTDTAERIIPIEALPGGGTGCRPRTSLRNYTETLDEYGRITGRAREDMPDRELLELIDDKLDALLAESRAATRTATARHRLNNAW